VCASPEAYGSSRIHAPLLPSRRSSLSVSLLPHCRNICWTLCFSHEYAIIESDMDSSLSMSDWSPHSVVGRETFLWATQRVYPRLWWSLRELCTAANSSGDRSPIFPWLTKCGVVDEWFIRVIDDTLISWSDRPDSPGARLEPGSKWFCCIPRHLTCPEFAPLFSKPFPTYAGAYTSSDPGDEAFAHLLMQLNAGELRELVGQYSVEPLADFETRMRDQFERQLAQYSGNVRRIWDYGSSPELLRDATMTAYRFAGLSKAEIARDWSPTVRGLVLKRPEALHNLEAILEVKHKVKNASSLVSKAIDRFAAGIGLTLPKGRIRARRELNDMDSATLAISLARRDKKTA
jgi:hypothetical protein